MGSKIHPDIFRLGISKDWAYQIRDPYLANVFIYKIIKKLFRRYTTPYISSEARRYVDPNTPVPVEKKATALPNPYLKRGFIFSHVNISLTKKLYLSIFLFDLAAERKRIAQKIRQRNYYYLSGKVTRQFGKSYNYFRKNLYSSYKRPRKSPRRYRRTTKWTYYKPLFRRTFPKAVKWYVKNIFHTFRKRTSNIFTRNTFKSRRGRYMLFTQYFNHILRLGRFLPFRFLISWISNVKLFFNQERTRLYSKVNILHTLKINLALLRIIFQLKNLSLKKLIFTTEIFMTTLFNILPILKIYSKIKREYSKPKNTKIRKNINKQKKKKKVSLKQLLKKRNLLFSQNKKKSKKKSYYRKYSGKAVSLTNTILLLIFRLGLLWNSLKYKILTFHKLARNILLCQLFSKIVVNSIQKVSFFNVNIVLQKYFFLNNKNFSASFISNYVCAKLAKFFGLNLVINPLVWHFKRSHTISGFKMIFSGRLTRKERASFIIRSHKKMPLSSYQQKIDYAEDFVILRFGVVGTRMYLITNKQLPYSYFFQFNYKL